MENHEKNEFLNGTELKYCKKCGRRLPSDMEDNLCSFCRNNRKEFLKKIAAAVSGVLAVISTIAIALLLNDKNGRKKKK